MNSGVSKRSRGFGPAYLSATGTWKHESLHAQGGTYGSTIGKSATGILRRSSALSKLSSSCDLLRGLLSYTIRGYQCQLADLILNRKVKKAGA